MKRIKKYHRDGSVTTFPVFIHWGMTTRKKLKWQQRAIRDDTGKCIGVEGYPGKRNPRAKTFPGRIWARIKKRRRIAKASRRRNRP